MKRFFYSILALCGLFSCQATVQDIMTLVAFDPLTIIPVDTAEVDLYALKTDSSSLTWKGYKPGATEYGIVDYASGYILLDDDVVIGGKAIVDMATIEVQSLATEPKTQLENHLKSADFLNVVLYPTATFEMARFASNNNKQFPYTVTGNLTILDVTKSISFKINYLMENEVVKVVSEPLRINRLDWGITYMSSNIFKDLKDRFIDDYIDLQVTAYFAKN